MHIKNYLSGLVLLLMTVVLFSACKKDEDPVSTVRMDFSATMGNEAFEPFESYTYYTGQEMTITKAVMYISNIDLVKSDGSTLRLSEVEYVDLSDPVNPGQDMLQFGDIPSGTYTGIRFGIGVAPGLNAMSPVDFSANHPLAQEGMYWDPWDSYIFSKTEGRIDTTGDGQTDLSFLYHTGIDDLYRGLEASGEIKLNDGETKDLNFSIDLMRLLGTQGDHIDIQSKPASHNPNDLDIATRIMDNYISALTFSF